MSMTKLFQLRIKETITQLELVHDLTLKGIGEIKFHTGDFIQRSSNGN